MAEPQVRGLLCGGSPSRSAGNAIKEDFPVIRFISMPLFIVKEYSLGLPEIAFRTSQKLDPLPLDIVHAHCPFASGTLALKTAYRKTSRWWRPFTPNSPTTSRSA